MRRLVLAAAVLSLTACPTYDSYKYVASEKGLMAPDEFAKYGPEQAIAVAIGREFGQAYAGRDSLGLAKQADAAVTYAKAFPQVKSVAADTLGHRLVVTFADGWSAWRVRPPRTCWAAAAVACQPRRLNSSSTRASCASVQSPALALPVTRSRSGR